MLILQEKEITANDKALHILKCFIITTKPVQRWVVHVNHNSMHIADSLLSPGKLDLEFSNHYLCDLCAHGRWWFITRYYSKLIAVYSISANKSGRVTVWKMLNYQSSLANLIHGSEMNQRPHETYHRRKYFCNLLEILLWSPANPNEFTSLTVHTNS